MRPMRWTTFGVTMRPIRWATIGVAMRPMWWLGMRGASQLKLDLMRIIDLTLFSVVCTPLNPHYH